MGDCASRPSELEIEEHKQSILKKHDNYFRSLPLNPSKDSINSERNIHNLETKRKFLAKKIHEFQTLTESASKGLKTLPELNIEVQKAVNLYNSCFLKGKPYVSVKLEPKGPCFETFLSERHKPYWYKFYQLRQNMQTYTEVVFRVYSTGLRKNKLIGKVQFKVKELQDQVKREGWFDLESQSETKPSLRLQIQLIHDEVALYKELMSVCEEKILSIDKAIQKIHDASYNSD